MQERTRGIHEENKENHAVLTGNPERNRQFDRPKVTEVYRPNIKAQL
jgi:hypothetical protein